MGNQRCIKGTMANMARQVSLKTPQYGQGGSISNCHCGRQEGEPLSLFGLKLADDWEEIVNTVFHGDTLMRLMNGVLSQLIF